MPRPRVAFFSFTSCEGCQLTVLEQETKLLELLEVVEIVRFREAIDRREDRFDVAFVEGSISTPEEEDRVRWIRNQAGLVVAIGACATLGGVNAIREDRDHLDVQGRVYGEKGEWYPAHQVKTVAEVVSIDFELHGCPMAGAEFLDLVSCLITGRKFRQKGTSVCVECVLRGTVCQLWKGRPCLGPISRGGCQAVCPSQGGSCIGCRGLATEANLPALADQLESEGLGDGVTERMLELFNRKEFAAREGGQGDGKGDPA